MKPDSLIDCRGTELELDNFGDIIAVLRQLNQKAGIRFEIEVQRPPQHSAWSCALRFDGNLREAELNKELCLFLERFQEERYGLESYFNSQDSFDDWFEKQQSHYEKIKLQDKKVEVLTTMERIQRRNKMDRQKLEDVKKAAGENSSQEI